jgi:hypothetical protein
MTEAACQRRETLPAEEVRREPAEDETHECTAAGERDEEDLNQDGELGFDAFHLDAVALLGSALEVRTPVMSEITAALFALPAVGLQVPALGALVKQRLVTTHAELDAFCIRMVAPRALHPSIVAVWDEPRASRSRRARRKCNSRRIPLAVRECIPTQ